ncbi:single-stranded-DNA-specific exonuclease RecJ [Sporolactobacillus kofuensis]|uniref:Single-stranded-DNA-specific exonuclease RecJ n=1 Tax=Sporolactobacillus kofuensis TaxID=269672 RepID=A0ABW1WBL7_9BACL|nr:single-stranded-DNA-specific exonuclease RecJ [Sporolactobacillus kofuensis]MCO7175608.1 single-stranded-DNA-specific exonuclease RecJ [Sporolactobacillus kofuensis]
MLKSNNHWTIKKIDEEKVQRLSESLHISVITARLLVARGLEDPEAARKFLHCDETTFYDSLKMKGMHAASERICQAIDRGEPIRIFGDYDADGVTSTAILVRALRALGAQVSSYIPNRFKNGYGPNVEAVEQARKDHIRLIVTVDSGIAAREPAELAKKLGIDYIITDHHEPPAHLPDADTILNPKQTDCMYPFKGLSGAGVALKLVQAICPPNLFDENWVALAAIGTIADLVPLIAENRLIAVKGLKRINEGSLVGIDALKTKASGAGPVDSEVIGFQVAPRINAAGRMDDAQIALDLLLTDDTEEAAMFAEQLERLNQERRAIVEQIAKEADEQAAGYVERGDKALVLAGMNWHQGVIGIAASKIVNKYYRPVIILSVDPETGLAKGSGRSIEGFNLYQGLVDSADALIQFGGHQMAAGLTLASSKIDQFRETFVAAAEHALDPEDLVPQLICDGISKVDDLSVELIEEIAKLSPFGTDNPRPIFQIEKTPISKIGAVGRDSSHLKMTFKGEQKELDAIGFGFGKWMNMISPDDEVAAVGELSINEWNGFRKPQLMIRDLRVEDVQVYDWRSEKMFAEKMSLLLDDSVTFLAFHQETIDHFQLGADTLLFESGISISDNALVLLDLPDTEDQLVQLIQKNRHINRFYCVFYHSQDHYFSAFPDREHFVWYYALIRQRHSFDLASMTRQISGYKGWTEHAISFMTQVFFDLGFVKIDKGILTDVPAPEKVPLTTSTVYQHEKKMREIEALFCYSPMATIKEWFRRHLSVDTNLVERS